MIPATVKKSKVLAAIDRRMAECGKFMDNPDISGDMKRRAAGAWDALLGLKIEIQDMDTQKEGREYPPFV